MNNNLQKVVVVTGGTSGIGLATAKRFMNGGWQVFSMSRYAAQIEGINHVIGDITDDDSIEKVFKEIYKKTGRIDLLVNNAGYGISGAIEFTTMQDAHKIFEANFFGGLRCSNKVIPYMRKQGYGKIVNVSSVAAVMFIPFQAFYSATKAATNALTGALANEVKQFGIQVCAVMPGDVKTGFTAARQKSFAGKEFYGDKIENSVKVMEHDEQNGMTPEFLAEKIYKIAMKKKIKLLYTPGISYKGAVLLGKILPAGVVNNLVGKIYIK